MRWKNILGDLERNLYPDRDCQCFREEWQVQGEKKKGSGRRRGENWFVLLSDRYMPSFFKNCQTRRTILNEDLRFRLRRSRAWFGHPQALCLYGDAKNNHFVESIKIFLFQRVKRSFCLISDCLPVQDSVEFKTEKGRSHKWGSPWILFACDRRFIRNCRQIRPGAVKIWNAEQDHDQKIDQDDRCKQDDDRFSDPARTAVSDRKLLIDPG